MQKPKLKICGMKYPENLQAVAALQPDYLGFIFYPKSKRYMADTLSPEVVHTLPSGIGRVGVFVNAETDFILEQASAYQLQVLQLHGDESPEECRQLQGRGYTLVKAFGVDENFDFSQLRNYEAVVDYYLFDTKGSGYGGHGRTFDWRVLEQYDRHKPFFLSGGIGLEEVEGLREMGGFPLLAIDVNSRFEEEAGRKNIAQLRGLQEKLELL
ncbi:phosphoribosylanthranilate isomerase [Nafulsella turpanensis]|uniref:phosphoribosylanthranilate isomerase n=1 Tax=Nafulsella turpanensis TaxID=1265690 RepID=UPI00034B028B|nr:phosphoribosylanthranilate isomerase [Nafulsella turpanensis]